MYPVMQWASVLRERAGQATAETHSTADAAPSARRPIDGSCPFYHPMHCDLNPGAVADTLGPSVLTASDLTRELSLLSLHIETDPR